MLRAGIDPRGIIDGDVATTTLGAAGPLAAAAPSEPLRA